MKYQAQQNPMDPESPTSALDFEFEDQDNSEIPDDAYVIGQNGEITRGGDREAPSESQESTRSWAKPAALVLVALFIVLTFWNAARFVQGPPPPPKPPSITGRPNSPTARGGFSCRPRPNPCNFAGWRPAPDR